MAQPDRTPPQSSRKQNRRADTRQPGGEFCAAWQPEATPPATILRSLATQGSTLTRYSRFVVVRTSVFDAVLALAVTSPAKFSHAAALKSPHPCTR